MEYLFSNDPGSLSHMDENISFSNFMDFPIPEFTCESQDFTQKVKELINELDSFQVTIHSSSEYGHDCKTAAATVQTEESCLKSNDLELDTISCNFQHKNKEPVLEANNLETLLQKFEATEAASSRICKTAKRRKLAAISSSAVIKSLELNTLLDTDHDYCSSSSEGKIEHNTSKKDKCKEKNLTTFKGNVTGKTNSHDSRSYDATHGRKSSVEKRKCSAEDPCYIDRLKILYVGKLPNSVDSNILTSLFSKYGIVDSTSIYIRKNGDNYGFVTFSSRNDAAKVLSCYKCDPGLTSFDLCYGARRTFCKRSYSDLDSKTTEVPEVPQYASDFDRLLQDAKSKIARKK